MGQRLEARMLTSVGRILGECEVFHRVLGGDIEMDFAQRSFIC